MVSAVLTVHLKWTSKSNTSNIEVVHSADALAASEWLHKNKSNVKSFLQFCFCQNEWLKWCLFIRCPQISFHSSESLHTLQWLLSLRAIFSQSILTSMFSLSLRTMQHKFPGGERAESIPGWSTLTRLITLGSYCIKILETINLAYSSRQRQASTGISKGIKQKTGGDIFSTGDL